MTQTSFPWDGIALGDAVLAPYTASFVSDIFETMFTINPRYQGIVSTPELPGVIGTSPTSVTVEPCIIMVKGRLYRNPGTTLNVVVPPSGQRNYYTIVARLTYASKTVRIVLLGPSATEPPAPSNNDYYYDVILAKIACDTTLSYLIYAPYSTLIMTGPTNKITIGGHGRALIRQHQGGDANQWATAGASGHDVSSNQARCMFGSIRWNGYATNGTVAVTFPQAFSGTPVVLASWNCGPNETYEYTGRTVFVHTQSVSTTGATFYWNTSPAAYATTIGIHWVAIGPGVNIS